MTPKTPSKTGYKKSRGEWNMERAYDSMFKVGDHVVCITGVSGMVIKQYYPTACEEQTMIRCDDGWLYHAPTRMFERDVRRNTHG